MSCLKQELEIKISELESAIIESLSLRVIQEYGDALTTLAIVHNDITSAKTSKELIPMAKVKSEELKKEIEILESNPQVKMYIGLLQKHAALVDSYRLIEIEEAKTMPIR